MTEHERQATKTAYVSDVRTYVVAFRPGAKARERQWVRVTRRNARQLFIEQHGTQRGRKRFFVTRASKRHHRRYWRHMFAGTKTFNLSETQACEASKGNE